MESVPDWNVVVTVRGGLSLFTREELQRYPLLEID